MAYEYIKQSARQLGLYRTARWIHRHAIDRRALRVFEGEVAFYRQFLKPGSLCFDVGANVGEKAEVFLALGARVVAFEPQDDCIQELQARVSRSAPLVGVSKALGSKPDRLPLHIHRDRVNSTFNAHWAGEAIATTEVSVTTLDAAIAQYGVPDFCKIDVESYELEVLRGLSRPIPAISYEYVLQDDGAARALACLEYLSGLGDLVVSVSSSDKPTRLECDWLPKDAFIEFFRHKVPLRRGYLYGDIFVKIAPFPRAHQSMNGSKA